MGRGVRCDCSEGTKGAKIGAIAGPLAGVEEMFAAKALLAALGSSSVDVVGRGALGAGGRASYLFNSTIAGIEESDAILLIGTNPRREAAIINARIRKHWGRGGLAVGLIGEQADLTYPYDYIGAGPETLSRFASDKPAFFELLAKAAKPMVVIGRAAT